MGIRPVRARAGDIHRELLPVSFAVFVDSFGYKVDVICMFP